MHRDVQLIRQEHKEAKARLRAFESAFEAEHGRKPEVLPYYSRLAATMALCFKHIDTELASLLKEEFGELAERKKQNEVELRLNNARYLAGLSRKDTDSMIVAITELAWEAHLDDFRDLLSF